MGMNGTRNENMTDVVGKGKEELRMMTAWLNVQEDILFTNVRKTEINLILDWADIESSELALSTMKWYELG